MENDIEQARASNMEEDKASSPNKAKYIEMATNIVEKLDNEMRSMSFQENRSECCIYRVPKQLRNVNLKVYAPVLISIGPLHRRNEKLKAMEKEKRKYFKNLTEHNGMDKKKKCDIVIHIKNQEERLRHCYSEKFKTIESDDFVEMILLDAIFIIQIFLESNNKKCDKSLETRMTFDIREDLMLFENQIPLFIIQDIYDRVNPRIQAIPFLDLATCYFGKYSFLKKVETSPGVKGRRHFTNLLRNLMLCKTILGVEIETSLGVEIETSSDGEKETSLGVEGSRHFTDLLRNLMLNRAIKRSYSLNPVKLKYTAVMLQKAGVLLLI
uniref:Uncharacterized protein n=1 Tax=Salix viminalis TaxID=40686 RepID=A0A6N2MKC0_SALVM